MVPAARKILDLNKPIEADLFSRPLDLLYAEHYRQRVICNTLDAACGELPVVLSRAELRSIVEYLTVDLPLHIADEEDSLFPLLESRCADAKGDLTRDAIELLRGEHGTDSKLIADIANHLRAMARGQKVIMSDAAQVRIRAAAEAQRRHLAWENCVLLPIAKQWLTATDLVHLGRAMAERRGIAL